MANRSVFLALFNMGFDHDQSRRAAEKFDDLEMAINWVLEGALDDPQPPTSNPTYPPSHTPTHHGRTSTPHPHPHPPPSPPPSTPSPTVSDLEGERDGSGGWKVPSQSQSQPRSRDQGWEDKAGGGLGLGLGLGQGGSRPGSGLVQDLQRGLTEDEALAEAIRLSQEETSSSFSQPQPQPQPREKQYNPPAGAPPPTLRLRPPAPAPPSSSSSTSNQPRPPPPPPPPSSSSTAFNQIKPIPDRQTRSPTPGPPELGTKSQARDELAVPAPVAVTGPGVVGSNNPFWQAMQPGSTPSTGEKTGSSAPNKGFEGEGDDRGGGLNRNVRFEEGGEGEVVPPDLLPPWLRQGGDAGAGGTGGTGQGRDGGLKKVSDDVVDPDGSRGMVLVPSSEQAKSDSMTVDTPARASQVDRRHPTFDTSGGTGGNDSPPPMDTYPTDRDEEQLALERAIKLSLTTAPHAVPPETTNKDSDENTVEGVVTGPLDYDMMVDDEGTTTRMAMAEMADWRREEDDTDFSVVRDSGAPLAIRSRTENTVWSAHVVQALISVPAIRRAVDVIDPENLDPVVFGEQIHRDVIDFLKQLVDKHDKRDISETIVTAKLDHFGLRGGPIALGERAYQMLKVFAPSLDPSPTVPIVPAKETLEPETIDVGMSDGALPESSQLVADTELAVKREEPSVMEQEPEHAVPDDTPRRLFASEMRRRDDHIENPNYDFCWMISHDPRTDKTLSDAVSNAQRTWRPNHLFSSLSRVFCLGMIKADRMPGETGGEALVGLEEAMYLDRFLIENADKVEGLNKRQTELRASIDARKKEMEDLVKYKGQDIDKLIERTIRYFDETYEMEGSRDAWMVIKNATIHDLRAVKSKLDEKRKVLSTALKAEETELEGLWDEPDLKLNKYDLQAVCFNSGWSGMNAIRSYIKGDGGQWWRIQESVVEKATFHDLATDNWGMMFDQGPYFLIYTRDSDHDDLLHPGTKVSKVEETMAVESMELELEKQEEGTRDIKPVEGDEVLVDVDVGGGESDVKGEDNLKV